MEMHNMNNEFLKDLHELDRSDEDRSKLLMKGIKKTLAERQSAGRFERWLKSRRKKKVEAWHSAPKDQAPREQVAKTNTERAEDFRENGYREGRYETRTE
ncbi:hypothetical protein [Saccharibacillus alkalitolerans]|uniref:Uncharacterized protein n=1 Tax=Saccharibacillus alkalitolerans TaxID=2705290 RepID=A0ABX0F1M6_9BACL|nr:hypothetical protein [Saccharibacillus alkalitolerans]NGZ74405.1 hypothetical protein [Saccharibacillus alkalitolerans]